LLIPQRLRTEVGIGKELVVLGVFDRMEIWDRETHERYESGHGGAYRAGTLAPAVRGPSASGASG
jgi:DNA-binding transcriptional regulator/RsmH inhibitor MraZ